jgi:co-chaperonin GroES (HSP10)
MRSAGSLIVEIKKDFKDEIQLQNGKILYLDPSYYKFENRVMEGKLTSVPPKLSDIFREGDRVFFHHSLVIGTNSQRPVVDWDKRLFRLDYTKDLSFNCLVYLIERDGEFITVNDFIFIEPIKEEKLEKIGSIYIPQTKEDEIPKKGRIVYSNDFAHEELGVNVGDEVYITEKGRYPMTIDGQELWRMRSTRNILAIDG